MGGSASAADLNSLKSELLSTYAQKSELGGYVKDVTGLKAELGNYAPRADIAELKAQLSQFLKGTEAVQTYLSKADYQSHAAALATIDNLKDFVRATDLDVKLASYLKSDALKDADLDKMVASLSSNNAFINNLSSSMARSSTALAQALAPLVAKDANFNNVITSQLKGDANFLGFVADKLTLDPVYKTRIQGPAGTITDATSVEGTLKPRTMWCSATGDVCSVPDGNKSSLFPVDLTVGNRLSAKDAVVSGGGTFGNLTTSGGGTFGNLTTGDATVNGTFTATGGVNFNAGKTLNFATDQVVGGAEGQKEGNAGQMGYNIHGGTAARPHLGIVGGGRAGQPRRLRVWDELHATGSVGIGNDGSDGKFYFTPGSDEWLRLHNKSGAHGGTGLAADKLHAATNLYALGETNHNHGFVSSTNANHWVMHKDGDWKASLGPNYNHLKATTYLDNDLYFHNGENKNQWITHVPHNDSGLYYVAPRKPDNSDWNWEKAFRVQNNGDVHMGGGTTLKSPGRIHIAPEEVLYLLPKDGIIVGKEWGGNGNVHIQGNLIVDGTIQGKQSLVINGSVHGNGRYLA
jgi:hypothetical protein